MVAQYEISVLGNLIRKLHVTFTECLFHEIWLRQLCSVHVDRTVLLDVDPRAGAGDVPLHQQLVAVVERDDVAFLEAGAFDCHHNLAFLEGRGHGGAVYLQNRQPQGCHQHRYCRHYYQGSHGTPQSPAVAPFILFSFQFPLQFGQLRKPLIPVLHVSCPLCQSERFREALYIPDTLCLYAERRCSSSL